MQNSFHSFFTSTKPTLAVYQSLDLEDIEACYKQRPRPWFSITATLDIFSDHVKENMVVVSVNGGLEITYLGLV